MEIKKLFKKSDIVIIAVCLLAALLLAIPWKTGGKLVAVITVNGKEAERINLTSLEEEKTLSINGVTVTANKENIYIAESDCKDKICVKTKKLTKPGDSCACVPNGVAVYIESDKNTIDAVVW